MVVYVDTHGRCHIDKPQRRKDSLLSKQVSTAWATASQESPCWSASSPLMYSDRNTSGMAILQVKDCIFISVHIVL